MAEKARPALRIENYLKQQGYIDPVHKVLEGKQKSIVWNYSLGGLDQWFLSPNLPSSVFLPQPLFLSPPLIPTPLSFLWFYDFLFSTVATESLLYSRPCTKDLGYRNKTRFLPSRCSHCRAVHWHQLETCQKCKSLDPTLYIIDQKLWEWEPVIPVLTSPAVDSKAFPPLRTPVLANSTTFSPVFSEGLSSTYDFLGHLNQSLHLSRKNKDPKGC